MCAVFTNIRLGRRKNRNSNSTHISLRDVLYIWCPGDRFGRIRTIQYIMKKKTYLNGKFISAITVLILSTLYIYHCIMLYSSVKDLFYLPAHVSVLITIYVQENRAHIIHTQNCIRDTSGVELSIILEIDLETCVGIQGDNTVFLVN